MRPVWKIVIWVALVLTAVVAILAAVVLKAMAPTTGTPIGSYTAPRTAFVVIDIQERLDQSRVGTATRPVRPSAGRHSIT